MRRSSAVIAPLLASAAVALLASCNSSEPQRCVDENNRVVDPSFCKNLPANGQPVAGGLGNNGGYYNNGIFIPHFYRYYYGGIGGGFGSVLSGGSYAPLSGHSYSVSGTTRNGFGSSFGGGEGGEGGGGE
jgi:hypothetical protein